MTYFEDDASMGVGPGGAAVPGGGEPRAEVRLAAKMAHELNNPLDAVLRFVSLAQRKAKNGEYGDLERHLNDAQFGLQRMTEILRELMEIGRESHELLKRPSGMGIAEVVGQSVRTMRPGAEARGVKIVMDVEGVEGGRRYDARLVQVVDNLVKNAVEASPESGVVVVSVRREGERVMVRVQDTGLGLEPGMMERLFVPFVTTKPRGSGNGLGLAISRELVGVIGGTVVLENRGDGVRGCVAVVGLPG